MVADYISFAGVETSICCVFMEAVAFSQIWIPKAAPRTVAEAAREANAPRSPSTLRQSSAASIPSIATFTNSPGKP